jgi:hypothetical protein
MHPCKLTIEVSDQRDPVEVRCEFDDSEWALLSSFRQLAADLEATALLNTPANLRVSFNWDRQRGLQTESTLPNSDSLAALLHRLRPFVLESEQTSFFRIVSVLGKKLRHPSFHQILGRLRDLYGGGRLRRTVVFTSNDVVINSERTLNLWLNSHEYHRDPQKAEILAALHKIMPLETSKVIFVILLLDKAEAISHLSAIIETIQGKQGDRFVIQGLPSRTRKTDGA